MPLVLNGTTGVQDNSGAFVQGTSVASTSGTSIDFTSIPSWVKRITVMFYSVSTNGSSNLQVQLGDSGGVETTGYNSTMTLVVTAAASTTNVASGFLIATAGNAVFTYSGQLILSAMGSNRWVGTVNSIDDLSTRAMFGAGSKTLSDTLTQVRITTTSGTDAFDAGTINILYE